MDDGNLEALRSRLAARKGMCWERLEDASSELSAVHGVTEDELVERVRAAVRAEQTSAGDRADP